MRVANRSTLDISNYMTSTNFLAANSKAIYVRHIRVARVMIKNEHVLPQLVSPFMDAPVMTTLKITHLDAPGR